MKVLFILALVGAACALQYPLEYEYQYRGVIATGIPSIRAQVSATGIQATLKLQMKSRTQGIAKLEEIRVGNFNGDAGCVQLREPVPIKYSQLKKYEKELSTPFGVNFAEENGHVMTVPKEDIEFMTNIRKSVVGILRVDPIIKNLAGANRDPITKSERDDRDSRVFSTEEETIFGRCESQYTLTRLPRYLAEEEKKDIEKYLKDDEQSSGSKSRGDLPSLGNRYFRLVKAVDFDKCHERVILMHSGVANSSKAGHGQFDSLQSRSSISTYILRGSEGNYRVERAIVEGDVILNPYGFKIERLHAITNQTLRLVSAKRIGSPLRLPSPTRNVKTWRYEVASPFSAPSGTPKQWVNYYNKGDRFAPVPSLGHILGFFEKNIEKSNYKEKLVEVLRDIVNEMDKVPRVPDSKHIDPAKIEGSITLAKMSFITRILRTMEVKDIEDVFEEISRMRNVEGEKEKMLLIDLMAASGAAPVMKVLLEKIKEDKITKTRIASIFMTLTNNLVSPVIIPELMEYAMSVDVEREPFVASAVLINFATVAHRVCLSHNTYNYSVPNPIFGKESCKAGPIINEFLEHLMSKAKAASEDWVKTVYIEAASNLGSAHVIPALRRFITGESRLPLKVRMHSVYALNRRKLPASVREEVFDLLMQIVDDLEEDTEIRQGSVAVLLSWHPDTAWWQRMARLTWREPSPSMAAFFTFTAEKMALATDPRLEDQARIAAFVLPLMKPFSPSLRYSYNYIYSRYDPVSELTANGEFAYLENWKSILPSEIYAALKASFGGFEFNLFEFVFSSEGLEKPISQLLDLFNIPESQRRERPNSPRDSESRRKHGEKDEEKYRNKMATADVYIRAFDHITAFFPINKDTITKAAGEDAGRIIRELLRGRNVNATKFINPMEVSFFVPTEIGLPVIASATLPSMILGNAEVRLEIPGSSHSPSLNDVMRAKKVHLLFKSHYRFMTKNTVSLKTLVPWEDSCIEAEIDSYKEINLPVYGNLTYQHTDEMKNLTLNLAPHVREEFPVIYASSIPSTSIKPLTCPFSKEAESIVVAVEKDRTPIMDVEEEAKMENFGLKSSLRYKSDKPYPFVRYLFLDYLRKPEKFLKLMFSPTAKQWEAYIKINPRESATRNVSLSISYLTPKSSDETQVELIRTRKPVGRRSSSIPDFSASDSQWERLEKVGEMSEGHQVRAINAQLFFNGSEFRKYEAIVAFTKTSSEESSQNEYKTVMAVMALKDKEPMAYCLEADTKVPDMHSLNEVDHKVEEGMKETIEGRLSHGRSCSANSQSLASFEGYMKISEDRKRSIKYELDRMCSFDRLNPVVELQTPAIYDEAKMEIEYKEDIFPKPFMNFTYNAAKLLEGLVYPHGYYNRLDVHNPEHKLTIEAKRPLTSKYYSFYAQKPKENVIIEELPISNFFTRIIPFLGLNVHTNRQSEPVLSRGLRLPICSIENSRVSTFDGLTYDFEPLHCYTTVANETQEGSGDFNIYTRKNTQGNLEIKITMSDNEVSVIASKDDVTVNGRPVPPSKSRVPVKDKNGRVVMFISRRSDKVGIEMIHFFEVFVENRITLYPTSFKLKSKLEGLCGNNDGNKNNDLIGPEKCMYDDAELFKYAWTLPEGEDCNEDNLQKEMEKVHKFQEGCTHGDNDYQSKPSDRSPDRNCDECNEYVYPIEAQVRGSDICISEEPLMRCAKHCRMTDTKTVQRSAKCWDEKRTPKDIKDSLEMGYLKHLTSDPAKYSRSIDFKAAKKCVCKNM